MSHASLCKKYEQTASPIESTIFRPFQKPPAATVSHLFCTMSYNLQSCISLLSHRQTCHHAAICLHATHPKLPQNAPHPRTRSTVEHLSPVHESLAPSDDLLTVFSEQWVRIMRGLIRGLSSCERWGRKGSQRGGGSNACPMCLC